MELTNEQTQAYERFIRARNKVGIVRTASYFKNPWIRHSDVTCAVDVVGLNHPLFQQNDEWIEYKEASEAWWAIEPEFRNKERMSAIRGDYGSIESWEDAPVRVMDTFSVIKQEDI